MQTALLHLLLMLAWMSAVSFALQAQPQRRANIWHFGNREGMDFSCGRPVKATNTKIISVEGATGICDENGQLLFYTNAGGGQRGNAIINGTIWNRDGEIMHDLSVFSGGGISSAQGGIVIPDPASSTRYYLFTVDELESVGSQQRQHRGLSYFQIDMALNNGLGAVFQSNMPVHRPAAECVTAARHSNGSDYWVLTVDFESRDLVAVLVTAAGVQAPIRYPRRVLTGPLVMKLSPDGRFLFDGLGLYRFDASDGSIAWAAHPPMAQEVSFSFSPSSRYLYTARITSPRAIFRYDLEAADIAGSQEVVSPLGDYSARQMQIGPDGNIYINTGNYFRSLTRVDVSLIQCPDNEDPQVIFDWITFASNPETGQFSGLSNFADFWFHGLLYESEGDTLEKRLCAGVDLQLEPNCQGTEYRWSTGAVSPQIAVAAPGEYRVSITTGCFTVVETFLVSPGAPPTAAIGHGSFGDFCAALPLVLNAISADADTLYWSTGETADAITIERGGQYTLTAGNSCGMVEARVAFPPEECCKIFVPNAFSPNRDGRNDLFGIASHHCPFAEFRLQVFSRWGELVFETRDPAAGWSGMAGSKALPPGVYAWLLAYTLGNDPQQRQRVESGEVLLLR